MHYLTEPSLTVGLVPRTSAPHYPMICGRRRS
jgi:hypothetical protein